MLELSHISKTYRTSKGIQTKALQDINLRFPKSGMVFVLGKSGSGKSTLLNIIGGLDQADEGEVIIHGKSSKTFTQADYDAYRNTYIGFIFQEFYLMDEYTIEKNIALSLQLQQKEAKPEDIEAILKKVGLEGYASRYPNELSGGQKQRIAIARSLIKQPEILMADEPTGALDSTTGKEIFDTLKELSKDKLVIVVSHDEEAAKRYADRTITFSDGKVIEDTSPEVKQDDTTFEQIKSHLPFKDSFYLGLTCLKHKKIRMIFTILLTSFALLTLAISDSVGDFNGVNAQYKAMQEHDNGSIGIQRQFLDSEGRPIVYGSDRLNVIRSNDAADIIKKSPVPLAKVYDSKSNSVTLSSMKIQSLDLTQYAATVRSYYPTEAKSFEELNIRDVMGSYPKDLKQVAISSYLADVIIAQGIEDQKGTVLHPATYEEIVDTIQIPIGEQWLTVSGIVKYDLSAFDHLKEIPDGYMNSDEYLTARMFSAIANRSCDKLFVKEGFIDSLKLKKANVFTLDWGSIRLESKTASIYMNQVSYPTGDITYFDGKEMKTVSSLKEDEAVIDQWSMATVDPNNNTMYSDEFNRKSTEEKDEIVKGIAKQIIGKQMTLRYLENYDDNSEVFKRDVKIKGVILMNDGGEEVSSSYVAKEVIDPYIEEPFYLGELYTNADSDDAMTLLKAFPIEQELNAVTLASEDVKQVSNFADFATQVFFWASIAFFIFAAALMMNFIVVSISYRKKEIGILRSIGARSVDVIKIFVWEALILAAISYVITLVGLYGISAIVNQFAQDTVGILISPVIITLRQPLILIVIVLVIACVASFLPILRIARQRPIDAIKK